MNYQIRTQLSKDGSSVYIYESDGKKSALNSLHSPDKEASKFIQGMQELERKLVVIIGCGNGIVIEKLLQSKAFQDNIHFLFIEPFPEVTLNKRIKDLISNNREKISFFYLNEFSPLLFSQFLAKFISVAVNIEIHPNYLRASKTKMEEIVELIKEGIGVRKILNNTEKKFALDWIIEPLLNLKYINKSISLGHLKRQFEGETAILVSAGPSLNANMSFIKRMSSSSHIFTVGSALRPLLNNEIKPDYVLSIDSSQINYDTHFKDQNFDGTLIFETMSNHWIQKEHKGKLMVCKSKNEHISSLLFNDNFAFPHSSPSVAIFTLQVIKFLGFKEVYLVGQDLALVNGEYYSEGVKRHSGADNLKAELIVSDNRGGKVGTTRALKLFLDAFEEIIKTFSDESLKIYNTSEYGAKIKGTEFVPVEIINEGTLKRKIDIKNKINESRQPVDEFVKDFIMGMEQLKEEVASAKEELKIYIDSREISKNEQIRMLEIFKKISSNEILEKVILSNLTFMFDNIINKFTYFGAKEQYTEEDLLGLIEELSNLYGLIEGYLKEILKDDRLKSI